MKNFALVGYGNSGKTHAAVISKHANLKAICDAEISRAEVGAAAYNATPYFDFDSLLSTEKNIDTIIIATPTGLHAEMVIRSLQAGINVICESPLCLTTAAAWQMIETAKFCRKQLYVIDRSFTLENISAKEFSIVVTRPHSYINGWKGKLFPGGGVLYTDLFGLVQGLINNREAIEVKQTDIRGDSEIETRGTAIIETSGNNKFVLNWQVVVGEPNLAITTGTDSVIAIHEENNNRMALESFYGNLFSNPPVPNSYTVFESLSTIGIIEKIYKKPSAD